MSFQSNVVLHAVIIGDSNESIKSVPVGTTGQVLQTNTGADPTWSTAAYPSSSGGSGKILYDNGTNFIESTPTFPASASATSRKIIVSDGTNWVASTETWAVPGTSGNVLTSDGTNWTSAASQVLTVTGQLTSLQIKALHGTPIQVVATPGSNKAIHILGYSASYVYGGTSAFTAGAGQTINIYYGTGTTISTIVTNGTLVGTANSLIMKQDTSVSSATPTNYTNLAINLYNPAATEITGNAANDNVLNYSVTYTIVPT